MENEVQAKGYIYITNEQVQEYKVRSQHIVFFFMGIHLRFLGSSNYQTILSILMFSYYINIKFIKFLLFFLL